MKVKSQELMRLIKITMCDDRKSRQLLINTLIPLDVTLMYFIKVSVFLCFPSVSEPAFRIHPGTQVASSCSSSENSWFTEADPRSKDAARASALAACCSSAFEVSCVQAHFGIKQHFSSFTATLNISPYEGTPSARCTSLIRRDAAGWGVFA